MAVAPACSPRTPRRFYRRLPSYLDAALMVWGGNVQHTVSKAETSFVERQNLTMRMGMRRFMRKTNGFSKRFEYPLGPHRPAHDVLQLVQAAWIAEG